MPSIEFVLLLLYIASYYYYPIIYREGKTKNKHFVGRNQSVGRRINFGRRRIFIFAPISFSAWYLLNHPHHFPIRSSNLFINLEIKSNLQLYIRRIRVCLCGNTHQRNKWINKSFLSFAQNGSREEIYIKSEWIPKVGNSWCVSMCTQYTAAEWVGIKWACIYVR